MWLSLMWGAVWVLGGIQEGHSAGGELWDPRHGVRESPNKTYRQLGESIAGWMDGEAGSIHPTCPAVHPVLPWLGAGTQRPISRYGLSS